MNVYVRLSAGLAQLIGHPRLAVSLAEEATIADLLAHLRQQYPVLEQRLGSAIPIIGGQHVTSAEPLLAGQEVALLLPVAGGTH
jgi:molybdopterin converting factor small subunit